MWSLGRTGSPSAMLPRYAKYLCQLRPEPLLKQVAHAGRGRGRAYSCQTEQVADSAQCVLVLVQHAGLKTHLDVRAEREHHHVPPAVPQVDLVTFIESD